MRDMRTMIDPLIYVNLSAIISGYKSFDEAISNEEITKVYALRYRIQHDQDTIDKGICRLINENCGYRSKDFRVWYSPEQVTDKLPAA